MQLMMVHLSSEAPGGQQTAEITWVSNEHYRACPVSASAEDLLSFETACSLAQRWCKPETQRRPHPSDTAIDVVTTFP